MAIDDFSTGYSSLSNLRYFPLDRLKVDQSFTREIENNHDATKITLSILSMAKLLNLKVIAEGVENIDQANFLRKNGCDEFKDFYSVNLCQLKSIPPQISRQLLKTLFPNLKTY